ncbi:glycoside hydrolase family 3 C-terminal domain-containing protein [Tamlana flava]|uniref:glycoside hydrolase family 3 C-terminal domain-containing protein n=1 Tax=Tamlana flava TaxID=3158572 RepID=UPI00351B1933
MKTNLFTLLSLTFAIAFSQNSDIETQMKQKAESYISKMTLEEKTKQLMNAAPGIEHLGIKPYDYWNEALHGVARNGRATVFPMPIGLGATFDTKLVQQIGDIIATEGRAKFNAAQKINNYSIYAGLTFWSPNVNIFRDPRWGRGQETYGEDPFLSGEIGTAFVKGLQGEDPFFLKSAACAKHYAVHSGPEELRHEFNVNPSKRDLYETYLPAFEKLVTEGHVEGVMGAYNAVYGESASGSPFLLKETLREKWGFDGYIVSDCGAVADIFTGHKIAKSMAEASAIAIKSGLNLNCGWAFNDLGNAIKEGLLTEKELDEALMPLMMTRLKLGILTDADESPYSDISGSVIASKAHAIVALEAAEKSMVLLKNDGTLPLDKNAKTMYVIGPHATDVFSMMGNYFGLSNSYSTYLEGIVDKVSDGTSINYKLGFLPYMKSVNSMDWALGEARSAEVCIVVMGISGALEGEEGDAIASAHRGDKEDIKLPEHQMEFLRNVTKDNNNKVVVVLTGGSPIDVKEISELADAVVMAWYPGQGGGYALGDLLFGDSNFSGRLPITFPVSVDKLPGFEDYTMDGRTYKYMEDNIMYPFGYGLTYSEVAYTNAKILNKRFKGKETLKVEVSLTNSSDMPVEEVAQVYISTPASGKGFAFSSLVDFKRVTIAANETKSVALNISPELLKTIQEDGSSKLLKGEYTLTVSGAAPSKRTEELNVPGTALKFKI